MVSVIVLTKNEEADLPACLDSVSWSNDIHVLDSGSTDDTVAIALRFGATVSINEFKSFGHQRNFAIDNLNFKNNWILFLDADEISTLKFKDALFKAIQECREDVAGFYCCWKMILEGTWLKRCDNFPKWQFRVLKKGRARYTDFGHGQKEADISGRLDYIKEPYVHFGFSKGWHFWLDRHNKYSTQEAKARLKKTFILKELFSKHQSVRNPALKSWLSSIPGFPALRFFYTYILRGGFWEGRQGFIYCINICYYEFLIQIKIKELQKHNLVTNSNPSRHKLKKIN